MKKKKVKHTLPAVVYGFVDDMFGGVTAYEKPEDAAPIQGTVELGRYVLEGRVFVTTKTEVSEVD